MSSRDSMALALALAVALGSAACATRTTEPLAARLVSFSERVASATDAIPHEVPEPKRADESFEAYAERARNAAKAGAGDIRDLVDQEKAALAGLAVAECPLADRYSVLVNAYSVVAGAVWAALSAPDAELLRLGLTDLDALNASLASTATGIVGAPDACAVPLETDGAALASRVVGTQSVDITRSPDRLHESALGDLVADARQPDACGSHRVALKADRAQRPSTNPSTARIARRTIPARAGSVSPRRVARLGGPTPLRVFGMVSELRTFGSASRDRVRTEVVASPRISAAQSGVERSLARRDAARRRRSSVI